MSFQLWCWRTLESPLDCKEIQPVHPKGNQSWIFLGRTDAEAETPLASWFEELTHLKKPWCWERLKEGGEGDNREWDGWMASPTRWTWVWVDSWSLPKFTSIELVMPSNHLILCRPFLLPPSIFPSIRVFSNESAVRIRWPRYWSFSFSISPSNEYSELISFP